MTEEEAVRMLCAVRVYCQPEHRAAVERAILALRQLHIRAEKNSILTKTGNGAKE